MRKTCIICRQKILTMTFVGTGVCSEICRKVQEGEITRAEARKIRKDTTLTGTPSRKKETDHYEQG